MRSRRGTNTPRLISCMAWPCKRPRPPPSMYTGTSGVNWGWPPARANAIPGATRPSPSWMTIARCSTWGLDLTRVLDLACGSGEATLALRELGAGTIDGVDPYTGAAYQARTGQPAEELSFEAIAGGALDGRHYNLVVCSYALHLLEPS